MAAFLLHALHGIVTYQCLAKQADFGTVYTVNEAILSVLISAKYEIAFTWFLPYRSVERGARGGSRDSTP
jgi:hypothetical protein